MVTAMTRNLGFRTSGSDWLRELLAGERAPEIALIQEAGQQLLDEPLPGYSMVTGTAGPSCPSGCTSAILVRSDVGAVTRVTENPFAAMGSYVAVATLNWDHATLWLVSAHASPTRIPPYRVLDTYARRSCEPDLWWSDVLLAGLASPSLPLTADVLVAGDVSESFAYDGRKPGHTCGAEFFRAVTTTGFVDVTMRDWSSAERPTRWDPPGQPDRLFASRSLSPRVSVSDDAIEHDAASDHAALWFHLDS